MDQSQIPWVLLAVFALLAVLQTARVRRLRRLPGLRARARSRAAVRGEAHAERVLRAHGYRVLERQVGGVLRVYVDGAPIDIALRADLIVRRRKRHYVAEVKTGALAPSIHHGPTRRQLLEYRLAFDVDGVLLVDPRAGTVCEVVFPSIRLLEGLSLE